MTSRLTTPAFDLGATVYQRAAPEGDGGMVTGLLYRPGTVLYLVTWGVAYCEQETQHWECELTTERAFGVGGDA